MKLHIILFATIYLLFNEKLIKCTTTSNTEGGGTNPSGREGTTARTGENTTPGADTNSNQNPPTVSDGSSGSSTLTAEGSRTVTPSSPAAGTGSTTSTANTQSSSSLEKPENDKPIVSAMLKNYNGVKVTGTCGADFGLFLVPHIYVHVKSQDTEIELSSELAPPEMPTKFDTTKLTNDCKKDVTKKFKFVAYINKDVLVFKWKVYTEGTTKEQMVKDVDVMKYILPNLKQPITSIQVHSWTGKKDSYILESKDYVLGDGMPEKCDAIATDCFLSGFTDIGKCFQCKLLMQEKNTNDSCFKYVSENQKELINHQLEVKGEDDEESSEYQLSESVRNILKNMYKKNDDDKKKELLDFENVNNDLKSELLNYCNLLKEVDMNNLLKDHELGNEEDIFNNLTKLLEEYKEENDNVLYHKMKNEALCLKNVNDWMKNKTGLVLPQLTYDLTDENNDFTEVTQNKNYTSENIVDKLYCNNEYCNRLKDHNNCVSKINVEDQKNCALSWAFASKYHLETIKCMKGYEPVNTSALYVANCGKNENKDVCTEGSNPLVFLQTVEEKGFLPTELNYPYDQSKVGDVCPEVQNDWDNAFENAKVLDYNNEPFSLGTKGYTAYESEHFEDNMDLFIDMVKREVQNKGSVIAYVKAENVLGYELNGKKVQNLCGDKTPDHVVNIVGYGNYLNDEGEKKSYWLVRNSWGKYWGDDGYFKVDMYGPSNCENNFIHSVVVFNVDLPVNENFDKKEHDIYNYYLKNSPEFYQNLYYKTFNSNKEETSMNNNSYVYGQDTPPPQNQPSVSGAQHQTESSDSGRQQTTSSGTGAQPTGSSLTETQGGSQVSGVVQGPRSSSQGVQQVSGPSSKEGSPPGAAETKGTETTVSTAEGSSGVSAPAKEDTTAEKIQIMHVLKHIKNSTVKRGLVKYDHEFEVGDNSCSRTTSKNPDNYEECVNICKEKWYDCRGTPVPGYCLSAFDKKNECDFCYV
ncbi:serine repeat antigen 4, putative [Plasmodium sp. gorilla clade G2]|uniref:serine repeat antigen 4, putative n=1 Tax=Plasmodium sp. gorilla clade G2 TaxID=880535 RepID=UPI000D27DFA4|nr:serine repeat antigen 4, putative [Plasmodium sp. gorilla clade G2]SOV20349.1 serine repeat antigen 4, putative [Plasmodium sp. gorilla clade G2]